MENLFGWWVKPIHTHKITMENKKGIQLNQAIMAVITLVLVAVLVIVALYLFSSLGSSMMAANSQINVINETAPGVVNENGQTLASTYLSPSCSAFTCYNQTGSGVIPAANYTATGCKVAYSGATDDLGYNNTIWKCSYALVYTAPTSASNATNVIITNFSGYPVLVGLIGTIIFLSLVIGILVMSFMFKSKRV
jgi:hypothetical protein